MAVCTAGIRHNIEEVGQFERFLPGLVADQGAGPADTQPQRITR